MFDLLTTADLYHHHNQLFDEHTRRYRRCMELPVTHPDYPLRRAAMDELSEHMHAIYTEILHREVEERITHA
jgi:hypothetical protein